METFEFDAEPWRWTGNGAQWVFVTVPDAIADDVDAVQQGPGRGFGAVRVRVTIGGSSWATSMFPSKEHRSYILPLKAPVRSVENVEVGVSIGVRIELIAV